MVGLFYGVAAARPVKGVKSASGARWSYRL